MDNIIYKPPPQSVMDLSVKDNNNQETILEYKSNRTAFLEETNKKLLSLLFFTMHRENGGLLGSCFFKQLIPTLMIDWAEEENLDLFKSLDTQAACRHINAKFVKLYRDIYLDPHRGPNNELVPDVNVFKQKATLAKGVTKRYIDMTAQDYGSLDVWRAQRVDQWNNNFRYKNKIPMWQKSMARQHYDTSNDGLTERDYRNASKPQPVRGYDMSGIYKGIGKQNNLAWTSI
jgi:hypothetical protein